MERTGWGQRIVQIYRWEPRTYSQVWLSAVASFGVLGLIIMSVIWSAEGERLWPFMALTYAVSMTFFGGLVQSWRLNRRRQRGL